MDLSGIIFVVLAIAWAVYLIPKALKHGDEVAQTRPVDGTDARRVLARREPVGRDEARLVVETAARPAASAPRSSVPSVRSGASVDRRTAARVAARRRRRVLLVLLAAVLAVAAACALGRLPWASLAAPVGLAGLFLLLCRTQVRREVRRPAPVRAPLAAPEDVPEVEELAPDVAVDEHGVVDFDRVEDTFGIPVAPLRAALAEPTLEAAAQHDGGLWDPLPVTLPTYVTKPKARRTVRTIDLGEPGTWTSGHTAEDAQVAAAASETPDVRTDVVEGRRAVSG